MLHSSVFSGKRRVQVRVGVQYIDYLKVMDGLVSLRDGDEW